MNGRLADNVPKAAVIRVTEHLTVELSPPNIRVNTVSPGLIETPALQSVARTPAADNEHA